MSVKVAVRVRPFNEREMKGNSKCCVKMVSKSMNIVGSTYVVLDMESITKT